MPLIAAVSNYVLKPDHIVIYANEDLTTFTYMDLMTHQYLQYRLKERKKGIVSNLRRKEINY